WTGFYAGVNGGWAAGNLHGVDQVVNFADPNGGLLGFTVGYNYQVGQFVVGVEGDWGWADIAAHKTLDPFGSFTKHRLSDLATARARFGWAIDNSLLYVTGGYAGGDFSTGLYNATGPIYLRQSNFQSGYAVGAGLEYAFDTNLTAKVEYLFTSL